MSGAARHDDAFEAERACRPPRLPDAGRARRRRTCRRPSCAGRKPTAPRSLNPQAWLTRAASRLAIDALRKAKGPARTCRPLARPEPVVEPLAGLEHEEEEDDRAERISLGFLHARTPQPDERAAFILHDAFDCGCDGSPPP